MTYLNEILLLDLNVIFKDQMGFVFQELCHVPKPILIQILGIDETRQKVGRINIHHPISIKFQCSLININRLINK